LRLALGERVGAVRRWNSHSFGRLLEASLNL